MLLKLYIYGYLNRVQSSRRLEREAERNVEVMWLTGRLVPDHLRAPRKFRSLRRSSPALRARYPDNEDDMAEDRAANVRAIAARHWLPQVR